MLLLNTSINAYYPRVKVVAQTHSEDVSYKEITFKKNTIPESLNYLE